MNYNAIISVHDISDDSGAIVEPVTLAEFKNYLRLEGFQDPSNIVAQTPITLTLAQNATTVQDNRLINAVILSLARVGTVYSQDLVVGNRNFVFTPATGTIAFLNPGNPGGEAIDIAYGYNNDSGIFNFTGDDQLCNDLITMSRQMIEKIAGITIVPKTWEAVIHYTQQCRKIEIPYGPNAVIWNIKDKTGTLVDATSYTLTGNFWKYIESTSLYGDYTLTYSAGYVFLPKTLKIDIMRLGAYMYENRGDDPKIESFAYQLASKYIRDLIS